MTDRKMGVEGEQVVLFPAIPQNLHLFAYCSKSAPTYMETNLLLEHLLQIHA